jgi:hypothetical protein
MAGWDHSSCHPSAKSLLLSLFLVFWHFGIFSPQEFSGTQSPHCLAKKEIWRFTESSKEVKTRESKRGRGGCDGVRCGEVLLWRMEI